MRYTLPRPIALAPLLLVATPAAAQQEDAQLWLQVNTVVPLAARLRVTLEQIGRFSDRQQGLYQTEFGGIVGYRATPDVEIGFGYRRVGAYNGNTAADEDRLRQHVVASFGPLVTRLRLDERFSAAGGAVGFRVRPLVRYNRRLGRGAAALFFSHESFFLPNSTSWGQRRGYERMRNIAGVALPLSRILSADVGYLNQYRFARGGARAQMDHALTVQVTVNLVGQPATSADD